MSYADDLIDVERAPSPRTRLLAALVLLDAAEVDELARAAESLAADRRRLVRALDADERPARTVGSEWGARPA